MTPFSYYSKIFDIRKHHGSISVRCPFHDDHTPSLSINLDLGWYLCFACGKKGRDITAFHREFQRLNGRISTSHRFEINSGTTHDSSKSRSLHLSPLWNSALELRHGDPISLYLRKRGLNRNVGSLDNIRFIPNIAYYENGVVRSCHPAMLARVDSTSGELLAVHRTYLSWDGTKAKVSSCRKLLGSPKDGAVQLSEPGEILGIAEGIETALAYEQLSGIPCWAALSANGLERVKLPESARCIYICIDHDEIGRNAVESLATRLRKEGREVRKCDAAKFFRRTKPSDVAPKKGFDWLDFLNEVGDSNEPTAV